MSLPIDNLIIECKRKKYITPAEREKFKEWEYYGTRLIAYPEKPIRSGVKTVIIIADLEYKEIMRFKRCGETWQRQ